MCGFVNVILDAAKMIFVVVDVARELGFGIDFGGQSHGKVMGAAINYSLLGLGQIPFDLGACQGSLPTDSSLGACRLRSDQALAVAAAMIVEIVQKAVAWQACHLGGASPCSSCCC